jgi:hypothetical protein
MPKKKLATDQLIARQGGSWTADKLYYLQRYATGFMTAMAPKRDGGLWEALVYIDLLAGPGIDMDRNSGREFPGSPLIALRTTPPFDRIFLGDAHGETVQALQQRIPEADAARVDLKRGDCHERARSVIEDVSPRSLKGSRSGSSCLRHSPGARSTSCFFFRAALASRAMNEGLHSVRKRRRSSAFGATPSGATCRS